MRTDPVASTVWLPERPVLVGHVRWRRSFLESRGVTTPAPVLRETREKGRLCGWQRGVLHTNRVVADVVGVGVGVGVDIGVVVDIGAVVGVDDVVDVEERVYSSGRVDVDDVSVSCPSLPPPLIESKTSICGVTPSSFFEGTKK